MVQHEINQDAGDGHIKPDRHRPAADSTMAVPAAPENWYQCHDHQRQCHEGEENVRDQKRKVNPCNQASIAGGFFTDVRVVNDVTDEKRGRRDEGGNHAGDVTLPDIPPDPKPAHRNENGADRVKRSIDRREITNRHRHRITRMRHSSKEARKICVNLWLSVALY